jgi:hypothetical protein
MYDSSTPIAWQLINFNRTTGGGTEFNLSTETWTVVSTDVYQLDVTIKNVGAAYELGIFQNGQLVSSLTNAAHPSTSLTHTFIGIPFYSGDIVQLYIRPTSAVGFNYQVDNYQAVDVSTSTKRFEVDQTLSAAYIFNVIVSDLMPEIKVREFLAGILRMYNMVIVPTTSTSFLLQPLDDWYAAGSDKDYQSYFDITEYSVNRPPLFREIEFKYQDTEQILGFQYQKANNTGFGDLRNFFPFDAEDFIIEVPFECPLFERLTDQHPPNNLTNVLVYKSITENTNEDGTFNQYLGAPVLFYGVFGDYDLTANKLTFVNSDGTHREVTTAWYANVSNSPTSAGASYSVCFGGDIDPYHLQSVNRSLYNEYWSDYITDLYNVRRRLFQIDAVLPLGAMLSMNLQNGVIWNNNKYIVNSVQVSLTTGKATFELLNVV